MGGSRCISASRALGYVFLLLYFFNYTNESFKGSMPANDDFKSDWQGREMGMRGGLEICRVSSSGMYFFFETTLHDCFLFAFFAFVHFFCFLHFFLLLYTYLLLNTFRALICK